MTTFAKMSKEIFDRSLTDIEQIVPFQMSQGLINDIEALSKVALKNAMAQELRRRNGDTERHEATDDERRYLNSMFEKIRDEFRVAGASYPISQSFQNPISVLNGHVRKIIQQNVAEVSGLHYSLGYLKFKRGDYNVAPPVKRPRR